jgi:pantothenate kinase
MTPEPSLIQSSKAPEADTIAGLVNMIREGAAGSPRFIVAVAGPPAAGKSTIAERIVGALRAGGSRASVIPMDGFHYDDAVLEALGLRSRKGSPPTFDVAGYAALLQRLKAREPDVAIPHFDRSLELSRAAAELVSAETTFLIAEGNYLLLDYQPWKDLRPLFDMTVFLDVPVEELDRRLVERWDHFGRDRVEARNWIDGNDLPNIRHVIEHSGRADIRFTSA